jgi:hypothetical protein
MKWAFSPTQSEQLLIRSLLAGPDTANALWRKWRAGVDLRDISSAAAGILPLFGDELSSWLENDPDKRVILGIRKQAWSLNRVRLHQVWTAAEQLQAAGIQSLATGAAASALSLPGRTLAVWQPALLVRRVQARDAVLRLSAIGWHAPGNEFSEATLNTQSGVDLTHPQGSVISLCWQLFPWPSYLNDRWEAMLWQTCRDVSWNGKSLAIPAAALRLIELLLGGEEWDAVRLCEALLMIAGHEVDWRLFGTATALAFQPQAVELSLAYLSQEWSAPVPRRLLLASRFRSVGPYRKLRALRRDYQQWIWRRERQHSSRMFAGYLCHRWNAMHVRQLPWLALERLFTANAEANASDVDRSNSDASRDEASLCRSRHR